MASVFILPADVFLFILWHLDIHDRIAFALTCRMFRQICVDERVFRKMDFSRLAISRTQRDEMNKLFGDRQLTQQIRELDFSNLRVLNWQMDNQLIRQYIPNCLHLEALHVLNCGLSFQRLSQILKQAPMLTALSWSLLDFTSEDIQFVVNNFDSSEGMCFRNIKHLYLELRDSLSHFQIAKYLLLSCFRELQELEIRIWSIDEMYRTGNSFPLPCDKMILGFPEPSVENVLQHLHSLMVVAVGYSLFVDHAKKVDFVASVLRSRSSSTKWKKFWISPTIGNTPVYPTDFSLILDSVDQDDFQSVEAFATNPCLSVDEVKIFFERIGDNTVRSLHLYLRDEINSIVEFCEPISRVGGHSLKCLRLYAMFDTIPAEQNVFIHTLFSNCTNITELDLLIYRFEKDICENLSKLKHLMKVQLSQCAISSKYDTDQVEISRANLWTFVENCSNITHLDVRCCGFHGYFSCCLRDDDLLALAKLRNLKSLTLYLVSAITEWTFLQNISEHCKSLTTLRITDEGHFEDYHIPILMKSAKFLKHLAINMKVPVLGSQVFWNLLSHAKNLERLCITCRYMGSLNIPVAVGTLKSLPRLHVLHLHSYNNRENVEDFYDEMRRMLEEKESDCRFSFEIVTESNMNMSGYRKDIWFNRGTGYSLIPNKALPINIVELCDMTPVLDIPRF